VTLELGREAQERVGAELDVAREQALRREQAGDDGGARRSHAAPVRDRVVRPEPDAGHSPDRLEGVRHRADDEVRGIGRHLAAPSPDTRSRGQAAAAR
jgi:hypothetical protein